MKFKGLSPARAGGVFLFMNGLLRQCLDWLNEYLRLQNANIGRFHLADMYLFVSVLLFSHTTGLSFAKTVSVLRQAGCTQPPLEKVGFIASHILAYPATGRGREFHDIWISQRDQTRSLSEFESVAFAETQKIFMVPLHLMASIDDDWFGTRDADNEMKMLSSRKSDREGNAEEAVANAFLHIIIALCFRKKLESQQESVKMLLEKLLEGRGEDSLAG